MEEPIRMHSVRRIRLRPKVAALFLLAALGLGIAAEAWITGRLDFPGANLLITTASAAVADQVSFTAGFTPVVDKVLPAVVSISSEKMVRLADSGPTFPFFDPFSSEAFGDDLSRRYGRPHQQRERSLGSGVFITRDGYLLTNNHVVEGASQIRILLPDKREMKAKVVGTDPRTDIAVLKVEGKDLPVLPVADSTRVRPGQFVLAVGNPFSLGETVTVG